LDAKNKIEHCLSSQFTNLSSLGSVWWKK